MSGEDCWAPGEAGRAGGSGRRVHILQANRDLELNWMVDLAKNLEEYLLKICSGEIDGDGMEQGCLSVNFAEAAILLQGSVQVYSRKVEYLYNLVLDALEFMSQQRHEQQGDSSAQPGGTEDDTFVNDNDKFLGLDDVPVETKTCLDDGYNEDDYLKFFVKPPQNLLVLEGGCLDTNVDAGELESYSLSTCNFYGDFLLLDPCDAETVCNILREKDNVKECSATVRGSLSRANIRSFFCSPAAGKSGGRSHKLTPGRKQDVNLNCSLENDFTSAAGDNNAFTRLHVPHDSAENDMCYGDEPDAGYPDNEGHTDDEDDPWQPLNPHEPGNLGIKPFRKGKIFKRRVARLSRHDAFALQFPLAKLEGTINPEFTDILANKVHAYASLRSSESPPLLEKLRQSLSLGEHESYGGLGDFENEGNDSEGDSDLPDFERSDSNLPKDAVDMDVEDPVHHKEQDGHNGRAHDGEACGIDDMNPQRSLEDLCRLHLDALLASITEAEQQTELATRVSTWKQKIECTLEDQDSRPPFDIQQYGEKILYKLHVEAGNEAQMCFTDIVMGQPKHDIARTFSALLQLVNNGDVDLDTRQPMGESICYTSANPFHVRLHGVGEREVKFPSLKKRVESPPRKRHKKLDSSTSKFACSVKSSHQSGKVSIKLVKGNGSRCTPESKRRRRSMLVEPVDRSSVG